MPAQPVSPTQLIAQLHALACSRAACCWSTAPSRRSNGGRPCRADRRAPGYPGAEGHAGHAQHVGTMNTPLTRVPPLHRRNGRVVADTFWRIPGVLRSDSPHSFAAAGPSATRITALHPVEILTASTARWGASMSWTAVLLLGIGHSSGHHHPPGRTAGRRVLPPPQIRPFDRASRSCALITAKTTTAARTSPRGRLAGREGLQRRGVVGHAGRAWSARVTSSKPWWKDSARKKRPSSIPMAWTKNATKRGPVFRPDRKNQVTIPRSPAIRN